MVMSHGKYRIRDGDTKMEEITRFHKWTITNSINVVPHKSWYCPKYSTEDRD